MKKKILCWFSCGVTSAIACKMAIEEYGAENVDIWYIEIASAHPDNERFIRECEAWFGVPIKRARSKKFADQFEVIRDTGYVNGPNGARCTLELKKAVRLEVQKQYVGCIQIFGFEYSIKEINRAIRFIQQYPTTRPRYPLIFSKRTKAECCHMLLKAGISLPIMYQLGYSNNNCIGCTKGGQGYWNKIRIDFPEFFEAMQLAEREAGRSCINGIFLDELDPKRGKTLKPVVPDCGSLCEIKYVDIMDRSTNDVYRNPDVLLDICEIYDLIYN